MRDFLLTGADEEAPLPYLVLEYSYEHPRVPRERAIDELSVAIRQLYESGELGLYGLWLRREPDESDRDGGDVSTDELDAVLADRRTWEMPHLGTPMYALFNP